MVSQKTICMGKKVIWSVKGICVIFEFNFQKDLFFFTRALRFLSYHLKYLTWIPGGSQKSRGVVDSLKGPILNEGSKGNTNSMPFFIFRSLWPLRSINWCHFKMFHLYHEHHDWTDPWHHKIDRSGHRVLTNLNHCIPERETVPWTVPLIQICCRSW